MAAIAIAGVGLMVVCSSSLAAVMMMGGDDDSSGGGGGGGAGPSAPAGVSGQYVELAFPEGTGSQYNLTPHEIYVYDAAGTNMALNQSVEVSSTHGGPNGSMAGPMAVDGDENTFWHALGGKSSIKIDLGAVKEIAKIEIKNNEGTTEYNGVRSVDRMAGGKAKITIYGSDGTTVVKSTPEISTPGAARYTIDLTSESPVWA
jgi:hypothetical protein